ncbi:Gfo/Idh/MocA family protein [Paucibacter sp. Y2R2-4]|uniref:Gfo/Idh/MocA family protein n=1 Tax=Paucibacter sp. Y2R2-4 TaxID=2893553 RepID=UPI0021E42BC1|nr:Gfo/Idh/MocA family oxidoreductase [Paucibacter sp. Y2R2-4]MCV2351585.1 Gfo/Idh/MocA family oxidoreductase [Paucibacter sp. Y2R2-4]
MRIAVIGLGDIAQKAYLPLLSRRRDVELVLCSRNAERLQALAQEYRISHRATSVDALMRFAPTAAFVHSSTDSHMEVATALLEQGVHVYLDKPIAFQLDAAESLVALARARQRLLMLGFNRRCAPLYRGLLALPGRHLALLQKHRIGQPAAPREFIYDDFIHVVDTLRFLAPGPLAAPVVSARMERGLLHHVSVQFKAPGFTGIGVMDRDSGASKETLELMSPGSSWRIEDLNQARETVRGREQRHGFGDWEPVLRRRGFEAIIEQFFTALQAPSPDPSWAEDALETHRLCEQIVRAIESGEVEPPRSGR